MIFRAMAFVARGFSNPHMMGPLLTLVMLYAIMRTIHLLPGALPFTGGVATTAVLGFVLITSLFLGRMAARLYLPMLTGYLLAGIFFGPYWMELFQMEHVERLRFVDSLALSFIALAVGGELEVENLKKLLGGVLAITLFQIVGVFGGVALVFYALLTVGVIDVGLTGAAVLFAALVLGVIATANSPATALAIINETRAKGPVVDTTLGVTVLKDVLVITLFAFVVSWIQAYDGSGDIAMRTIFSALFKQVAYSLVIGAVLGALVIVYIGTVKEEMFLFTLGVAVVSTELSGALRLNELLVCIAAGFVVKNFSRHGGGFTAAIEKSSLPVFVVFFSMAGASLNLHALREMWLAALAYFSLRLVLTWGTTDVAVRVSRGTEEMKKYLWVGYISQAGVSLGLAVLIKNQFPGWGTPVATLIVASVAINQVIGPVMFKLSLIACGEAGKGGVSGGATHSA